MRRPVVTALFCLFGIISAACADAMVTNKGIENSHQGGIMHISVRANGNTTLYELNDSPSAKELYEQLPLTIKVEPYSDNEMIFYPPKKLATDHTPMANARAGTLAYYAPWGDVVMFYKDFGKASGLYELGQAVSGMEYIRTFSGTIRIEKND